MKFFRKHNFKINMGLNVAGFALSFGNYLNAEYKTAYEILLVTMVFVVTDLIMMRFLQDDEG